MPKLNHQWLNVFLRSTMFRITQKHAPVCEAVTQITSGKRDAVQHYNLYIVASEQKDPICHSDECQIGSFSSEATTCSSASFLSCCGEVIASLFLLKVFCSASQPHIQLDDKWVPCIVTVTKYQTIILTNYYKIDVNIHNYDNSTVDIAYLKKVQSNHISYDCTNYKMLKNILCPKKSYRSSKIYNLLANDNT